MKSQYRFISQNCAIYFVLSGWHWFSTRWSQHSMISQRAASCGKGLQVQTLKLELNPTFKVCPYFPFIGKWLRTLDLFALTLNEISPLVISPQTWWVLMCEDLQVAVHRVSTLLTCMGATIDKFIGRYIHIHTHSGQQYPFTHMHSCTNVQSTTSRKSGVKYLAYNL